MKLRRYNGIMVLAAAMITALLLISPVGGYVPPGGGGGDGGSGGSSGSSSGGSGFAGSGQTAYSGHTTTGTFTLVGENWAVSSCSKNCPTPVTMTAVELTQTVTLGPLQVDYDAGSRQQDDLIRDVLQKKVIPGQSEADPVKLLQDELASGPGNKQSAEAFLNQLNGNKASNGINLAQHVNGVLDDSTQQFHDTAKAFLQNQNKRVSLLYEPDNSQPASITAGMISDRIGTITGDLSLGAGSLESH
jgi:hypothetical protein